MIPNEGSIRIRYIILPVVRDHIQSSSSMSIPLFLYMYIRKLFISLSLTVGLILVNATEQMDLLTAALLACFGMLATRCITLAQAFKAIKPSILLTIAAAFGLGTALDKTGVAKLLAQALVGMFGGMGGGIGVMFGVYLATCFLTAMVANAAAVIVMFPIVVK